jgi:hypothetical protein
MNNQNPKDDVAGKPSAGVRVRAVKECLALRMR